MVTVKEVKKMENATGEEFFGLIVQSGAMAVKSNTTGRVYFTAKTALVATTFDEQMANSMIGQEFEGTIKKVQTDPYEYTIEETGEVIELSHRWEYVDPALEMEDRVVPEVLVL